MDLQLCVRLVLLWQLALGRDSQGLTHRSGGSRDVQPYFNPVVKAPLRYSPPGGGLSADHGGSPTDSIPTGNGSPIHPNPAGSGSHAGYSVSFGGPDGGSSPPGSVSTYRPGALISSERIQLPLLFHYQTSTDVSQQPAVSQTKAGMWDIALSSSVQPPSARLNFPGQTPHWPPQYPALTHHQQLNPHHPPKYPAQTTHRAPQYQARTPKYLCQTSHMPKPPQYLAQTSRQPKPPQYLAQTSRQPKPPQYLIQNPQWLPKYLGQNPLPQQFPITPDQHQQPFKYLVQTPHQHRQPPRYLVQQPQLQYQASSLAQDLHAPSEPEVNRRKTILDSADQYADLSWQPDQDHQFFNLY